MFSALKKRELATVTSRWPLGARICVYKYCKLRWRALGVGNLNKKESTRTGRSSLFSLSRHFALEMRKVMKSMMFGGTPFISRDKCLTTCAMRLAAMGYIG